MQVTVNTTVSYAVSKVDIAPMQVIKDKNGSLVFMASFRWLDASNAVLRQASNRYSQEQLIDASPDKVQSAAMMTTISSLFVDGIAPALRITVADNGTATVLAFHSEMVGTPPVKQFIAKTYTEDELVAKGLNSVAIASMITQLAAALTA